MVINYLNKDINLEEAFDLLGVKMDGNEDKTEGADLGTVFDQYGNYAFPTEVNFSGTNEVDSNPETICVICKEFVF